MDLWTINAMDTAAGHSTMPQLPQELVTRVLREVALQQRLGSCSLVCKSWRAAAGAATNTITLDLSREKGVLQADSMGQWLAAHGSGVAHLTVHDHNRFSHDDSNAVLRLQLPCAVISQLQQLDLRCCHVTQQPSHGRRSSGSEAGTAQQQQQQQEAPGSSQHRHLQQVGSSSNASPTLASLSSLTALTLVNATCGVADGLAGLSALTGLQQLLLGSLAIPQPWPAGEAFEQQQQQLLHSAFNAVCQLSRLTRLELCCHLAAGDTPAGLFRQMQQLKELELMHVGVVCPDVLQDLPPSITRLELKWRADSQLSSSTVPSLAALTALQHLVIRADDDSGRLHHADAAGSGGLHPGFMSSMQQLRTLSLQGPLGGSTGQQQQQQLGDGAAAAATAMQAFVNALPGLSQLESLAISNTSEEDMEPLPASQLGKYAALLPASTHLTCLELAWREGCLLPGDCWQHVLAGGWQLPQLKQLWLGVPAGLFAIEEADYVADFVPFLGHSEMAKLVQGCPGLQLLSIPGLVQLVEEGVSPLMALTALTAITHLYVGGNVVDDAAASSALAALTGLQSLQISHAPLLSDRGLLALAALRGLTELEVWSCEVSQGVSWDDYFHDVVMLKTKGTLGLCDVWLQVAICCTHSPYCAKEATMALLTTFGAQQQRHTSVCQEFKETLHAQFEVIQNATQTLRGQQQLSDESCATLADMRQTMADMRQVLDQSQALLAAAAARGDDLQQQLDASHAQLAAAEAHAADLQQQLAAERAAAEARANHLEQLHASQAKLAAAEARANDLRQQLAAETAQQAC